MERISSLLVVVLVALVAGGAALLLAPTAIGSVNDDAAKATILAGVITLLGVIFSAMYGEISSYYHGRAAIAGKRWELIFPLVKQHYYPLVNSGKALTDALRRAANQHPPGIEASKRILYLVSVFYGYHLRLVMDTGGLVLLSSTHEEREVDETYRAFRNVFQWAGEETPRRVSYLQGLFVRLNKPENPYVLEVFSEMIPRDQQLQESLSRLVAWESDQNLMTAAGSLEKYTESLQEGIDKLYSAW